jgi:class 3 adenylate cyclase/tetratricopeptide (TPR) repeat protein
VTITDERRLVTVLFADLVGFTGRAEQSDPEAVREFQRTYFAAIAAEVERFGGGVEKFIGDAAMALFGAPTAHDDDAERALRTALSIREAVGRLEGGLEVRIGVNTGEVVGGTAGPQAGDYTVSGDAVNVAARLQQAAAPNEILVGGMTRRLSAGAFAFAPREEMALKGRAEPMEVWRLERELPERPSVRDGEALLVGRERELASLESALDEAAEGRGLMVALAGEPGIGKSRLALEVRRAAEANGFTSAWTSSRSYASAFPYHLVRQLVPQLLDRKQGSTTEDCLRAAEVGADDGKVERWAAVLDDVLGEAETDDQQLADLSPSGRQRILVHAIGGLLRSASERQPMLLVLDDLHWADPASLAVVEELLEILPGLRLVLLATYRSNWSHGWEGRSAYEQLNLRALRAEDARRMAAELSKGASLSTEQTERVLERSAGNPLFLEELLHGERSATSAHPHRLPATIHEMLLARLDALAPNARRTLQLASVMGMEFSERIVADLSDLDQDETDDALRALQRAELITSGGSDGRLGFRHPLIHEVAYGSLLVSTRRALHGRIGRWLEEHGGEEQVAELARHYRDSDDLDKARHYLPVAGRRAQAFNANREAYGWFTDAAFAFADDPERRAEMLVAAAQQRYLLGEINVATTLQEEAIALYEAVGAERSALDARRWLGRFRWLLGDPNEAERQIDLAIDGLERLGPSPELAMAYSFRSQSVMLVPDFEAGAKWARKAIAVAEATGATAALVHAYNNLGLCLLSGGDRKGADYLRLSRDLALEHHLPDDVGRANTNLSGQGNRIMPFSYAEMEELLSEGTDYAARTIPDGIYDRWIRSAWGEFLLMSGRWDEAEGVLFGLDASAAEAYLRSEVLSLRALLLAYRGRYQEAVSIAVGAAETGRQIGDLQAVLPTAAALAASQAGLGQDADAVATVTQAIERRGANRESTISTWLLFEAVDALTLISLRDASSVALRSGVEALAAFVGVLAPDATRKGDLVQAEVRRALFGAAVDQLGRLAASAGVAWAPPKDSFPDSSAALAGLDREHRRFDAARIRLWMAEAGEAVGDRAAAVFEELRAVDYADRARRVMGSEPADSSRIVTGGP